MPLLEIITRHLHTRPKALQRNQQSLQTMLGSSPNWVQTVLVDDVGRGVAWANAQLRDVDPVGDWVWVLDDDDECILPDMFERLELFLLAMEPDAVVVRMDHGQPLGILPPNGHWHVRLQHSSVGVSALITSRATWMVNRHAWGNHYAGDWDFIDAVQSSGCNKFWWDVVASRTNGRNMGAPE